jgi:hypothetical protein
MANFAVDPRPHAPRGFEVIPHNPEDPPRRLSVYLGGYIDAVNDDIAIAMLVSAVVKEDFNPMAQAITDFFIHQHHVCLMEVRPCTIGDAYVKFSSSLERERFLDGIYQLTPEYQMHFVKHDEGVNARAHPADREAWVMLLNYPLDAKSNALVAKPVAGFGLLRYWHDTNYMARIVVRVILKEDAGIPHDVSISVGRPPLMKSWTCPVFALKCKNVTLLADEDELLADGLLHPLPVGPPCWMGPNPVEPSSMMQNPIGVFEADVAMNDGDASVGGGGMYQDGVEHQGVVVDQPLAHDAVEMEAPVPADLPVNPVVVVDHVPSDAAKALVALSFLPSASNAFAVQIDQVTLFVSASFMYLHHFFFPFHNLLVFEVNLDTLVPPYISMMMFFFISLPLFWNRMIGLVHPLLDLFSHLQACHWCRMPTLMMMMMWSRCRVPSLPLPGSTVPES